MEQTGMKYMYVSMSTGTSIVCPRKSPLSIPLTHPARERAREGKAHGRPLGISKTVTGWLVGSLLYEAADFRRVSRYVYATLSQRRIRRRMEAFRQSDRYRRCFCCARVKKDMALCSAEMVDAFSWSGGGGSENRARLFEDYSRRK